jgi:hypothetical protein
MSHFLVQPKGRLYPAPVFKPHTPISEMLKSGWMRDFTACQTQTEIGSMGIEIHLDTIMAYWAQLDREFYAAMARREAQHDNHL